MVDIKTLRAAFDAANRLEAKEIREAELRAKPARDAYLAALEADTKSRTQRANIDKGRRKALAEMAVKKPYTKKRKR